MARPRGTELRIVAAEACGAVFGPTGTGPRRVVRLPTADSLCDRMERGEEEAIYGPPRCLSAQPFLQTSRPVGFRRAAAENFRPEIFDARATLREQRESAVGRRSANLRCPRWPEDPPRTPPPPQPPEVRPRLLGIEECPHYARIE